MKKLFLQSGKLMLGDFPEEPKWHDIPATPSGCDYEIRDEQRDEYNAAVSAAKASAVEVDPGNGFYKALLNAEGIATGEGSDHEVNVAMSFLTEGQLYDLPEGWTVEIDYYVSDVNDSTVWQIVTPELYEAAKRHPESGRSVKQEARLIPLKEPENLIASQIPYPEASGIVATGLPESESILYGLSGMAFKSEEAGILESGETLNGPFNTHPARNFPEDYEQENGNYINTCSVCKLPFRGNKHRVWCRMCDEPNWEELSKIQKPEINSPPMAGCWLEGEMVGFARCMVKRVKPLQEEIARLKSVSPPPQAQCTTCKQYKEALASILKKEVDIQWFVENTKRMLSEPPPQAESQEGLIRDLLSNYTRSWLEVKSMSPEEDALIGRIADKYTITRKP